MKYNYYKNEKKLHEKKEELFKLGQIAKYEIPNDILKNLDKTLLTQNKEYAFAHMCTKENEVVTWLKRTYSYYNHTLIEEFRRIRDLNGEKHREHFIKVSEKHTDVLTDVIFLFSCM